MTKYRTTIWAVTEADVSDGKLEQVMENTDECDFKELAELVTKKEMNNVFDDDKLELLEVEVEEVEEIGSEDTD